MMHAWCPTPYDGVVRCARCGTERHVAKESEAPDALHCFIYILPLTEDGAQRQIVVTTPLPCPGTEADEEHTCH